MSEYIIDIRIVVPGENADEAKENLDALIPGVLYEIMGIGQKFDNPETI